MDAAQVVAFMEFQTAVEEIFDVQLLGGIRFPEVVGFQKETLDHTFIVPRDDARRLTNHVTGTRSGPR